jgi:serine/threonine protein kinase
LISYKLITLISIAFNPSLVCYLPRNLVRLIGFCCEGDKRLLLYEHVVNGSLDAHLFQHSNAVAVATALDWSKRYRITVGVARGLCYLHQSYRECIIHCDIKPENILLDASFAPKIADFGMAAFVGRDFSRVLTTFRGTAGYLAPEWLSGVPITPKVDVYSFGMVVLEIVSGQRNTPPQALSRETSAWRRRRGCAKSRSGASKTTSATGRPWLTLSAFLRASRSSICPQCQYYLQLLQHAPMRISCDR